ncbi:unnamed protein product [Prorocentrum cordatum]|uniref:J domain-containing protein n=1 Tax=Prorocentrum cordatum TaxID=2364126 RepID=A0ABN9VXT8_9DINO|nr:unnamed protein product [Polarella glacialis]
MDGAPRPGRRRLGLAALLATGSLLGAPVRRAPGAAPAATGALGTAWPRAAARERRGGRRSAWAVARRAEARSGTPAAARLRAAWALLDLPEGSSRPAIKRRFRELVKTDHPDKRPDDPLATQRFGRVMSAYKLVMEARGQSEQDAGGGQYDPKDIWDTIEGLEGVWEEIDVSSFDGFVDFDANKEASGATVDEVGGARTPDEFQPGASRGAAAGDASSEGFAPSPGAFQSPPRARSGPAPSRVGRVSYRSPDPEKVEVVEVASTRQNFENFLGGSYVLFCVGAFAATVTLYVERGGPQEFIQRLLGATTLP